MRAHALLGLFLVAVTTVVPSFAQQSPTSAVPPPGSGGAAFSTVVVEVANIDAETQFWSKLGATRRDAGGTVNFDFPDMTVAVVKGSGEGGTPGSVIDHIGLQFPNVEAGMARYRTAGLAVELGPNPNQGFVTSPSGVRIELLQDPAITVPVRGHHVHFFMPAPLDSQAWYAKHFGAVPGKRGPFDAANITANTTVMNLTFSSTADQPRVPTKGRALDRIVINVADVGASVGQLRAEHVTVETAREDSAVIVDPWGTRIELRASGSVPK